MRCTVRSSYWRTTRPWAEASPPNADRDAVATIRPACVRSARAQSRQRTYDALPLRGRDELKGQHTDATGRRAITDDLLAQLAHDLPDALIIADAAGKVAFWNSAAEELFGWPAADAMGQSLDLIIPERLRERHWSGYTRVMESGQSEYSDRLLEVPALHRDGHTISIAFKVALLTEPEDPRPFGIAAVLRDDTARWEEQRRLREQVASLEARQS